VQQAVLVSPLSHTFPLVPYAAARKCFGKKFIEAIQEQGSKIPLLEKCARSGHWGVFEHATMTFELTASRACLDQLNRYRHSSICMESQRHVDVYTHDWNLPDSIGNNAEALALYKHSIEQSRDAYKGLVELGVPREDARNIIGMGVEVSEIFSLNLAEFFHIRRQRLCSGAQKEIRELVFGMSVALLVDCPDLEVLYMYATPDCKSCENKCNGE